MWYARARPRDCPKKMDGKYELARHPAPEADKHDHLPLCSIWTINLDNQVSTSDQHGNFKSKEREPVSTLNSPRGVVDG